MAAAVLIRFRADRNRLWVPVLSISIFGYFPILIFLNYAFGFVGGGLCGIPEAVTAGRFILGGGVVFVGYELLHLKVKRNKNKI